jgi:hypothetical protein
MFSIPVPYGSGKYNSYNYLLLRDSTWTVIPATGHNLKVEQALTAARGSETVNAENTEEEFYHFKHLRAVPVVK